MSPRTPEHQAWVDAHKARPHVLLLGAGASKAALPDGDANGRRLPLINDFIEVVGLEELLEEMGIDHEGRNIESLYSELAGGDPSHLAALESAISTYFESLLLPDHPTIYDYIVLSVTEQDLLATFNWDPFLIQAIRRNLPALREIPPFAFLQATARSGIAKSTKSSGRSITHVQGVASCASHRNCSIRSPRRTTRPTN